MLLPDPQKLKGLLRDFELGLGQEMFFFGLDVRHGRGNLLCHYGFQKRPSPISTGTSCYRLERDDFALELYGSCMGLYSPNLSLVYLRPRRRVFLWNSETPLIPGDWFSAQLRRGDVAERYRACAKLASALLPYRHWLTKELSPRYRLACHEESKKRPAASRWLTPPQDLAWWNQLVSNPQNLPRARQFQGGA